MVNQMMMSSLAQKLGAGMVNTASTNANSVDLRPLVGLDTDRTLALLDSYKISKSNLTQTDVSSDPTWTDSAIASAASYTPASFNLSNPLTMYTRNKLTVGFEVTNPADVLSAQVTSLQKQVNDLCTQISRMQQPTNLAGADTAQSQ